MGDFVFSWRRRTSCRHRRFTTNRRLATRTIASDDAAYRRLATRPVADNNAKSRRLETRRIAGDDAEDRRHTRRHTNRSAVARCARHGCRFVLSASTAIKLASHVFFFAGLGAAAIADREPPAAGESGGIADGGAIADGGGGASRDGGKRAKERQKRLFIVAHFCRWFDRCPVERRLWRGAERSKKRLADRRAAQAGEAAKSRRQGARRRAKSDSGDSGGCSGDGGGDGWRSRKRELIKRRKSAGCGRHAGRGESAQAEASGGEGGGCTRQTESHSRQTGQSRRRHRRHRRRRRRRRGGR